MLKATTEFTVKAWNEFRINGSGNLVIGQSIDAINLTEAMDEAERMARAWNKNRSQHDRDYVNFLTCNGHIRTV